MIFRLSWLLLFFLGHIVYGQDCRLVLEGYVRDRSTGNPLSFASLKVVEDIKKSVITDEEGHFIVKNLCPDDYHFDVSYVGFETDRIFISITSDTSLTLLLNYHDELLSEIIIHGEKEENTSQVSTLINQEKILQEANKNLADMIEGLSGVSVLRTGSGISKPVINGLYGNRITILNNGIAQAGQQWGNDHAPEIDPFVANHISVVKGSAALEYMGNSIGGIVRVEPEKIDTDPHIHGKINYIFQTNGMGSTLNSQVARAGPWASWKLSGTLKLFGDLKTPDYYLTNSGKKEANLALQMEKKIGNTDLSLYISTFNTEIGILRGSHISSLTDLEMSIGREEPFFTSPSFSYSINPPRQVVHHHLIKISTNHKVNDNQRVEIKYAGQLNQREEFDVRRSGRSDIPALSLDLYSHFLDGVYDWSFGNGANIRTGIQFNLADNTNNPETGVLPLIPNYESFQVGTYFIFQQNFRRLFFEIGVRYDGESQQVTSISRTTPRTIVPYENTFHNYATNAGLKYELDEGFKTGLNVGYSERAPEINELYSFGLHQGVSGIEEGDPDLVAEKSIKGIANIEWSLNDRLFVQGLGYLQWIEDYIYLQPQNEFRLTIRGAFPVFRYEQTDARLIGSDWSVTFEPNNLTKFNFVYAMVRGQDIGNDLPLIFMPADNLNGNFSFFVRDQGIWKDNTMTLTGRYVFEQSRYSAEQDFLAPPGGYFLLGVNLGTHLTIGKSTVHFKLRLENILNNSYRDYLNRQRYFADEPGFNANLGVNLSF